MNTLASVPMSMGKPTIIVTGNPVDGFAFFGPFDVREDAETWAEQLDDDWWLADLMDVTP